MTVVTSPPPTLTPNDGLVLSQIFAPSAPFPTATFIDYTLPAPHLQLLIAEIQILAPLNTPSPSDATIRAVIAAFDVFIKEHPNYASAYNNRAQATRLLIGDDLRTKGNVWTDLSQAIALAGKTGNGNKVSKHEAKVLAMAYTQRAWLVWKFANEERTKNKFKTKQCLNDPGQAQDKRADLGQHGDLNANTPEQLKGMTWEQLEEVASRDFEMGGRFGNDNAREMAVRTNVHAKLCGSIVREAMAREMGANSNDVRSNI